MKQNLHARNIDLRCVITFYELKNSNVSNCRETFPNVTLCFILAHT